MSTTFFAYLRVEVTEEDDEAEGTSSHGLSWDEGVLEGGLSLGLDHRVQGQRCELQNTNWAEANEQKTSSDNKNTKPGCSRIKKTFSKSKCNVGCFTYILDEELEILRVTEGGLQWLNSKILATLVGETHKELHDFIGRKLWMHWKYKTHH